MASSSSASTRACWSAARWAWKAATARRCSAWAVSWRTRAATAGLMRAVASRRPGGCCRRSRGGRAGAWSVTGEFGDGFLGAGVVDEVLAGGRGGDERGGGGVVEGAGQAGGDPVQPGDRIVGEQRFLTACEGQVMAQVGGGFGEVHRLDRKPGGDPLVQGGEHAHPQLPAEGGLPGQDPGDRKSTRLNSSHVRISYAVFCLKKKKQ